MTLDEVDRLIAEVRRAASPSEACYALAPLMEVHKLLEFGIARSEVYWRARRCEGAPWTSLSQMLCPPPALTTIQRLNDKGAPIFYAATHEDTALSEIGVAAGDIVQVAGFQIRPGMELRLATFGEFMHVYKMGRMRSFKDGADAIRRQLAECGTLVRAREIIYVDACLAGILSDAEAVRTQYLQTRALASLVLVDLETDGFLYPSVKDHLGTNIALRPSAVDATLVPVACYAARITQVRSFGLVDREVVAEATGVAEGAFAWTSDVEPGRLRFFNMTKDEYERARSWDESRKGASAA